MTYKIRSATQADEPALQPMLPRLADFEVPNKRSPKDLWFGDLQLLQRVLIGTATNSYVFVAVDGTDSAVAVAMYTLKPELLSGAPSAHLEALSVHPDHTRQGLAKQLIEFCTDAARQQNATSMSLNVFSNNEKARSLYKACGFDEELIRCYKTI